MKEFKKWTKWTLLVAIGLIFFVSKNFNSSNIHPITQAPTQSSQPVLKSENTYSNVTKVFDGDTIQIDTGQKVRYIGIDTTEVYPKVECYSQEAKKENENLVLDKTVRLEKDVSETDKYGRLLRYVYLDNIFVNDKLVRSGYAKVFTFPPDVKYKDKFLESERYARENNLGLWRRCL